MTYRKTQITASYDQWEAVLTYMQETSDPYCMKYWLDDVLKNHAPDEEAITLPTYGAGTTFIDRAMEATRKDLTR